MSTPYDAVPYPGRPYVQTHPDRLATMATLFGLAPTPPARATVLELGCGDGANLLPMALALPGARFVGIDPSQQAIAAARALAAELGVANVSFDAVGVEDHEAAPGSVDYVIAHGVYSWIGAAARDRLLALCGALLSAHGVAYVSYNALPGSRPRQTLRELLALALEGIDEPAPRLAAARAWLRDACELWPGGDGLETTLGGQARVLLQHGDAFLYHDTLAPDNEALRFADFAAHAAAHELQYLAEAEFTEMQTGGLPPALRERVEAIEDLVRREQLLDALKQRMFRQTLLCRADAPVDRVPRAARVAGLAAAGPIAAARDPATGRVTFRGSAGASLTTDHPLLVTALERIGACWPGAARVPDLVAGDDPSGEALGVVCEALLPCFAANLVRLHAHPPDVCPRPGARPRASPLARIQARRRELLTTQRHTSVQLEDELGWRLVALLDGSRDRAALHAALKPDFAHHPDLAGDVERSLDTLARVALLTGDGG